MSVGIKFPLEFLVQGTPVSQQAKRVQSIEEWKARVIEACQPKIPQPHFATELPVSVTLLYFPDGEMQGDIDNIVKPILDALCKYIYVDDKQVQRVWVQKFEPGNVFEFASPSATLQEALNASKPVLYVRVSDEPFEDLK